jgi:copper(I)-binding protein
MMRSAPLLAASVALTTGLLAGCGAGQITQTEQIRPPVSGVNVDSADGTIQLREVAIVYEGYEGYAQGGTAPLRVWIANSSHQPVKLIGVTSDAGPVAMAAGEKGAPSTAPSMPQPSPSGASPGSPSGSPPGSPSVSPPASPSGSVPAASPSGSVSPPASPSGSVPAASPSGSVPAAPPGSTQISVEIPTDGFAVLAPKFANVLQIVGTTKALRPGDTVEMTFRFDNGTTITTKVPIEIPLSAPPRSPLEFDEDEH